MFDDEIKLKTISQDFKCHEQYHYPIILCNQIHIIFSIIKSMYVQNKAIQIHREGRNFHVLQPLRPTNQQCEKSMLKLKNCLIQKNVSVLDSDGAKASCDTTQWRSNCTGEWRRYHIERIYQSQTNLKLYGQQKLDEYMKKKNKISHFHLE